MARYIITEKQERLLKEINVAWGKFAIKPVVYFYRDIINNIPSKKRKKLFQSVREFFRTEMGVNIDRWDDGTLEEYLKDIKDNEASSKGWNILNSYPKIFKKPSTISSLAYYLMKNLYQPKEYQGLEYIKYDDKPLYKFFFFDPEIQEFVGCIEARTSLMAPKSMKIILSAVEPEYVGRGYGSRIYLCLIDQVDYLFSDNILYPESLNMWVNYLPKKVNVWAELDEIDEDNEAIVVKLSPKVFVKPHEIESLVASSKKEYPPDYSNL
jgi:hypothetical protein